MNRVQYFDRHGRELSQAQALDHRGTLKDGTSMRTPLTLRDGKPNPALTDLQRSVASRGHVTDAIGSSAFNRPGFRITTDAALRDAREAAYRDYDDALVNSTYKTPPGFGGDPRITGQGEHGQRGQREGDACTVRNAEFPEFVGAPGHIRNGVCVPDELDEDGEETPRRRADHRSVDQIASEHRARMAKLYDAIDAELCQAYRKG